MPVPTESYRNILAHANLVEQLVQPLFAAFDDRSGDHLVKLKMKLCCSHGLVGLVVSSSIDSRVH